MEVDFIKIPFNEFESKLLQLIAQTDSLLSIKITSETEYNEYRNKRWELVKASQDVLLESFNNGEANSFYRDYIETIPNVYSAHSSAHFNLKSATDSATSNINELRQHFEYLLKLFQNSDAVKNPEMYQSDRIDMTVSEKETFLMVKLYELHRSGLQFYIPVKDIFYSNRIPLDYLEDFDLVKKFKSARFIEDIGGISGPLITLRTEGKRAVQEHLNQQPQEVAQPVPTVVTNYHIGNAGVVGNDIQINNSTINSTTNYALPPDTNYELLASELERLIAHLMTKSPRPEQFLEIGDVAHALEGAKEGNGKKVVEFLKKSSIWVLDGAKDIATDIIADIIKKSMNLE